MSAAWTSYRGAPARGTPVCALTDVPEGDTHCLELDGFPILLVRAGGEVGAYVNACPHQYMPLNHKGDRLISADGTLLRCTNHSASFSVVTGQGVEGLGIGTCLDPVPVTVQGGTIYISPA